MADEKRTVVVDVEVNDDAQSGKSFEELAGDIRIAGVSFNGLTASLKNAKAGFASAIRSLKALRLALIGTGIGALLVALGSLLTFLQKTQAGSDVLSKRLEQLGAVVDVLVSRFAKLGESIFKAFTFDFEGAGKALTEAVSGITEELEEAVVAAGEFADAQVALEEATISFTTRTAEIRNEIAKRILITRDLTRTDEERRTALAEAAEFEQEQLRLQIDLAEQRLQLAKDEVANTPENLRSREQLLEVATAQAELTNLQTDSLNRQREILNRQNELENQIAAQRTARTNQRLAELKQEEDALFKALDEELKAREAFNKDVEELGDELLEAQLDLLAQQTEAQLNADIAERDRIQQQADFRKLKNEEALDNIGEFFERSAAFAKNDSKVGKALASAGALIDTFRAAAKALTAGPFIGPILAGIITAQGLATVSKINSTNPTPAPKGAKGGDIFDIGGRRHSQGGTMFWGADGTRVELEAGEKLFVLSRGASAAYDALSSFNKSFTPGLPDSSGKKFQAGGEIPTISSSLIESTIDLQRLLQSLPPPQVSVRDITELQNRIQVIDRRGNF